MKIKERLTQSLTPPGIWPNGKHTAGLTILASLGVSMMFVVPGIQSGEPARSKALTAVDVVQLWSPRLKSQTDYGQFGGSPEQTPNVAAYSFRVVGPSFEELWNHYAERCGVKKRYAEKAFLVIADTGANGSYVVSERPSADGGRGPTVFLLKTDTYTVTVTFQLDPDRKSISGSLTAAVP